MKKRLLVLVVAVVMVLSLGFVAGCSGSSNNTTPQQKEQGITTDQIIGTWYEKDSSFTITEEKGALIFKYPSNARQTIELNKVLDSGFCQARNTKTKEEIYLIYYQWENNVSPRMGYFEFYRVENYNGSLVLLHFSFAGGSQLMPSASLSGIAYQSASDAKSNPALDKYKNYRHVRDDWRSIKELI